MQIKFFATPAALRKWLEKNHDTVQELWVGFYKKSSGKPSITWPEAVDQLLCFGWIDGVRKSVDDESYSIRVTPASRAVCGARSTSNASKYSPRWASCIRRVLRSFMCVTPRSPDFTPLRTGRKSSCPNTKRNCAPTKRLGSFLKRNRRGTGVPPVGGCSAPRKKKHD